MQNIQYATRSRIKNILTSEGASSVGLASASSVELAPQSCLISGILSLEQRDVLVELSVSVALFPIAPSVEFINTAFPSASLQKVDLDSNFRAVNVI